MAHLDYKGPEGLGPRTGRKPGSCKKAKDDLAENTQMGTGMGLRRHAGGGTGHGKRLQYKNTDKNY